MEVSTAVPEASSRKRYRTQTGEERGKSKTVSFAPDIVEVEEEVEEEEEEKEVEDM